MSTLLVLSLENVCPFSAAVNFMLNVLECVDTGLESILHFVSSLP